MAKQAAKEKVYYIVNPAGCIHGVDHAHAQMRLRQLGYRLATAGEVKELQARKGLQVADDPICEPWSPEPVEIKLPDEPQAKDESQAKDEPQAK